MLLSSGMFAFQRNLMSVAAVGDISWGFSLDYLAVPLTGEVITSSRVTATTMVKTQRRTLCYLGREQDGTNTLSKSLAHWENLRDQSKTELRKSRGERRQVIRRRIEATEARIAVIKDQLNHLAIVDAERQKKEQMAEEALYWQAFEEASPPSNRGKRQVRKAGISVPGQASSP